MKEIDVTGERFDFVDYSEGKSTDMYLRLGKKQLMNGYKEYVLGGLLGRNIGYGEITIYCRGAIKLRFDESALIDATEYCLNTKKYGFH